MYNLLELFKGTGSIGKVAHKMNMNIVSLDMVEKYKPDILIDIMNWDYKAFYKTTKFAPDFIWASPPCNTYSVCVYRLRERNPQTAEPYSDRAIEGTKVLYKTLEIILFFKNINPNLLYVIENPRGMMRNDKIMKTINRTTTKYSAYGDNKKKVTDFFNNLPHGLSLLPTDTITTQKLLSVEHMKTIEERYSIPSKLVKSILEQMIKQYKK